MVYHIKKVGSSTARRTLLIGFISHWATYALLCGLVFRQAAFMPWLAAGMALPAALVTALQYRRVRQNTKSYEDIFYTLTEGGLMVEGDHRQSAIYISWADVSDARRVLKNTVYLQRPGTTGFNCLLEGLPQKRIAEFADFAARHAGTTPPASAHTPPPAALLATTPLIFSATPEQRRILADARVQLTGTPLVWNCILPLLLL